MEVDCRVALPKMLCALRFGAKEMTFVFVTHILGGGCLYCIPLFFFFDFSVFLFLCVVVEEKSGNFLQFVSQMSVLR